MKRASGSGIVGVRFRRRQGLPPAIVMLAVAAVVGLAMPAWGNHSTPTGKNCSDFTFQEDAQAYFDAHPGDPEGLDGPIGPTPDGIPNVACENLPSQGTSSTVVTLPPSTTTTIITINEPCLLPTDPGCPTTTTTIKIINEPCLLPTDPGCPTATTTKPPTTPKTPPVAKPVVGRTLALTG